MLAAPLALAAAVLLGSMQAAVPLCSSTTAVQQADADTIVLDRDGRESTIPRRFFYDDPPLTETLYALQAPFGLSKRPIYVPVWRKNVRVTVFVGMLAPGGFIDPSVRRLSDALLSTVQALSNVRLVSSPDAAVALDPIRWTV